MVELCDLKSRDSTTPVVVPNYYRPSGWLYQNNENFSVPLDPVLCSAEHHAAPCASSIRWVRTQQQLSSVRVHAALVGWRSSTSTNAEQRKWRHTANWWSACQTRTCASVRFRYFGGPSRNRSHENSSPNRLPANGGGGITFPHPTATATC